MRVREKLLLIAFVGAVSVLSACGGGGGGGSSAGNPATAPAAPAAATVTPGNRQLSLSWTAVSNATAYEVWYHTTDNSAAATQDGGDIAAASHVITGLSNGSTYYVWLKAKNAAGTSGFGPGASAALAWVAGDRQVFSAQTVTFTMAYVPGGMTFPTGLDDNGTATVGDAYWIGETEVTYELWKTVYDWATDPARGSNVYYFVLSGRKGNDNAADKSVQHPVTYVNWRNVMVWTNALTEWYNAQKGTSYECVYTYSGAVVRNSGDTTACDNAVAGSSAKGFRLLTGNEWELAARWRNDSTNTVSGYSNPWFTQGDSASGATADSADATATGLVAWYNANSGLSTHEVKGKGANALGLYDMSGNVGEWCFDLIGSDRRVMNGDYDTPSNYMSVGLRDFCSPTLMYTFVGFRLGRTQ